MEKSCFGILDKVFPEGKHGLREVPPECFECQLRTECLKTALSTEEGIEFRVGLMEQRPSRGFMARIRRWSEKKTLSRLKEKRKG